MYISITNDNSMDVTAPKHVEVLIHDDGKVIWINVNGICLFRACRIGELVINDERTQQLTSNKKKSKQELGNLTTCLRHHTGQHYFFQGMCVHCAAIANNKLI